jgi:DNA-binding beta-propeller fold protein YncE
MRQNSKVVQLITGVAVAFSFGSGLSAQDGPLLPQLAYRPFITSSTIPPNGDLNPYGVAFVPMGFPTNGAILPGDVLVSNFNSSANLQGTGTTISRVTEAGATSLFFQSPHPAGLSTALGCLSTGFVIVGNVPTTDGTSGTLRQGSLVVLDRWGNVVVDLGSKTYLDGPWDLAIAEEGNKAQVFVSDVLNGSVTRLDFTTGPGASEVRLLSETTIASGYTWYFSPTALVIGPTGLAYDATSDVLYVASTGDNAIYSIASAKARTTDGGVGTLIYSDSVNLHGPLGLLLAPNGDLIASNGDAVNAGGMQNELVEFTITGSFVADYQVDSGAGGAAFGIAVLQTAGGIRFAAIDDDTNSVTVWRGIH